jgi:hypothetical protein
LMCDSHMPQAMPPILTVVLIIFAISPLSRIAAQHPEGEIPEAFFCRQHPGTDQRRYGHRGQSQRK